DWSSDVCSSDLFTFRQTAFGVKCAGGVQQFQPGIDNPLQVGAEFAVTRQRSFAALQTLIFAQRQIRQCRFGCAGSGFGLADTDGTLGICRQAADVVFVAFANGARAGSPAFGGGLLADATLG